MILGAGIVFAWFRLKTSSLWPAVLLHASHNLFIQNVFTPLTQKNALTPYFIDEFRIMLAVVVAVVAYLFWRKRRDVQGTTPSQTPPSVSLKGPGT